MTTDAAPRHELAPTPSASPVLEVVVPVHNEEARLGPGISRLRSYLATRLPLPARITIVDNASTDRTLALAREMAAAGSGQVHVLHLDRKGRGGALRAAWLASDAEVVCYMDVDLSTDLRALLPLVAPLVSGHSDVAIGTRLAPGARVVRSRRRELISCAYNRLLRVALGARFSDAQCGFKALTRGAAQALVPEVEDDGWFFDTELLHRAERRGLRIHEVPVDWIEDGDSRVEILSTALADLRGIARLRAEPARQLARFAAVGATNTLLAVAVYAALLAAGAAYLPAAAAGFVAGAANGYALNRRWTFRAGRPSVRQAGAYLAVALVGLAVTLAGVAALVGGVHAPKLLAQALAVPAATLLMLRLHRAWTFPARPEIPTHPRL
jgi:putative flippase GtrA